MSKSCTVCAHASRAEIVEKLFERAATGKPSLRALEKQFGIDKNNIDRHARVCLPASVAAAKRHGQVEQGIESAELLAEYVHDARKIRLACSEWMTDPDNPDAFSLDKRAGEVMVIYLEGVRNGVPLRRKKTLQELLKLVQQKLGIQIADTEMFGTDPRKLYLDLFRGATALLTLRANLLGEDSKSRAVEQRDWVGWVKGMAQKYGKDEMQVARDLWERHEDLRAELEGQWPELASPEVM